MIQTPFSTHHNEAIFPSQVSISRGQHRRRHYFPSIQTPFSRLIHQRFSCLYRPCFKTRSTRSPIIPRPTYRFTVSQYGTSRRSLGPAPTLRVLGWRIIRITTSCHLVQGESTRNTLVRRNLATNRGKSLKPQSVDRGSKGPPMTKQRPCQASRSCRASRTLTDLTGHQQVARRASRHRRASRTLISSAINRHARQASRNRRASCMPSLPSYTFFQMANRPHPSSQATHR